MQLDQTSKSDQMGLQVPVVFLPISRRKALYTERRKHLGEVFWSWPSTKSVGLTRAISCPTPFTC